MPTAGVTHDLTIATIGGSAIGFMLARKNGRRGYKLVDARSIAPRILSESELTEAQFPTEYALYASQENWRAGLGGQYQRLHPNKYAMGYKMEGTVEGTLRSAREVNTTTVDSNPTAYKFSGFAKVGTEVWGFGERDVYSWNYGTTSWNKGTAPQAVANVYRNGIEFGANTFVPAWTASSDAPATYIYKADVDANWTLCTLATKTFKYFAKGRNAAGSELLWGGNAGGSNTHSIYHSTDPTNAGAWTGPITIGNSDSEITGLVEDGSTVLVLKTDGIWAYYTDGTSENLTPDFERMAHPDNFRAHFNWNGHVLVSGGANGLYEVVEGKLYNISMELYAPDQTTLHGRVVAITGNPDRVFMLVQETATTSYHLLMAEWAEFEGTQDYRWHHVGNVAYTTNTIEEHCTLFAEGIPSGATIHHRVWVGVESTGSNLLPYFYPLATDAQDGYTNDTDAYAITTKIDLNLPKVAKSWASIDFESTNLGAGGRLYTVAYRLDAGSWTTDLTDAAGNADGIVDTSSRQTMTFPAGTTGNVMELRFKPSLTTVGATSPELLSFRVTCQLRPTALKTLPLTLYLADGVTLLTGIRSSTRPNLELAQLETWDSQAAEVTVIDPRGTSRSMVFLPGLMSIEEVAHEPRRRPEYLVSVLLAEV